MRPYKIRDLGIDLLCDILGALLFDLGVYNFAVNAEFAPAGVSGIALILRYLFQAPMGVASLLLNVPILLVSARLLGKTFLIRSIKTMIIFSLVLDYGVTLIPTYSGNPLYAAICTGVLSGLGLAVVYLRGGSTGGTDFLVMSVKKLFPHLTIGQITLAVDSVVILVGGAVFRNIDAVILGLISTAVITVVIDKIMYGLGAGKLIFIVTSRAGEAAKQIEAATGRGCTFLEGQGAYSMEEKKVVMCACNNRQVVSIRSVVHRADPEAFMIITDSNEVFGEGFKPVSDSFL